MVPEERNRNGHMLGNRFGTSGPAEFLEQQDQIDGVHA